MENKKPDKHNAPRPLLTLKEAAEYTGIGVNKLRELSNADNCNFVLFVGNKRLIKINKFLQFIDDTYSI